MFRPMAQSEARAEGRSNKDVTHATCIEIKNINCKKIHFFHIRP